MNIEKVKTIIAGHGYIALSETGGPVLYDWNNKRVGRIPWATVERIKRESGVYEWRETWGALYVGHYLCQKYVEYENHDHCKRIAEEVEAYADGRVYRCPDCDEIIFLPDDVGDKYKCPDCGEIHDVDDLEQLGIYDYMGDILDIEYTCNCKKEYRSCSVCVAWGGPNIYIETDSSYVRLYWGGNRAEYPLSYNARDEIDNWAEEYFNCL